MLDPDVAQLQAKTVFEGDRFPNVVVTLSGAVLLVYGREVVRVRRSEDGGSSWSDATVVAQGIHSGGVTVDERTGHVLIFVEDRHPPAPLHLFRSVDDGLTWAETPTCVLPDARGNTLAMHFNESGVTLRGGQHAGRLLRPARWYAQGDYEDQMAQHYTSAVYSDDGGTTWHASEPFPAMGTGEAALAQLGDGSVYYNTRRHWAPNSEAEGQDADVPQMYHSGRTRRRWSAFSSDGASWSGARVVSDLPDGPQGDNFGLFGGLTRLEPRELLAGTGALIGKGCRDVLLFSNVDHPRERRNGAVWLSLDGGKRWRHKRVLCVGEFGYSALAAGRAGTPSEGWIYCFYEGGPTRSTGEVMRFNAAWLLDGLNVEQQAPRGRRTACAMM